MASTEYSVYLNDGSVDGTALDVEDIEDDLRWDEKCARISQLLLRASGDNPFVAGRTVVVQATALVRS